MGRSEISGMQERIKIIKYEPTEIHNKDTKECSAVEGNNVKGTISWTANMRIEKYNDDESYKAGVPDEVHYVKGNTATMKGLFTLWQLAMGNYINTTNYVKPTYSGTEYDVYPLDNTNTYIGVGNGAGTAYATDDALEGDTQAWVKCDSGYPIIDSSNPNTLQVSATFGPGVAEGWNWHEWGIANGNMGSPGTRPVESIVLFNRRNDDMGQKGSNATWVIIADLIIAPNASASP